MMLSTNGIDPPPGRPWISTDMVMSMDGAYSRQGTSGALSSPADHALFIAHRNTADAILVGASTVRKERYRRPIIDEAASRHRRERGQSAAPVLVVVSASIDLGSDTPLLHGEPPEPPEPIIVHPSTSDISAAPAGFELIVAGTSEVDLRVLLGILAARGIHRVACEGGPRLLGQLAEADLIDEYLLTISPQLVGGTMVGLVGSAEIDENRFVLHQVLHEQDHLMCSYRRSDVRARSDPPGA